MAITAAERQKRLAERLAEAEEKAAKLRQQKRALDAQLAARASATARKAETQAKILAGAAALSLVKVGRLPVADLLGQLVERDRERLAAFLAPGAAGNATLGETV